MTSGAERLMGSIMDLSESDFKDVVVRLLSGMGLSQRSVRTSGRDLEVEAVLDSTQEQYYVLASRALAESKPADLQRGVERMRAAGIKKGIFLLPSGATREAGEYADQFDVAVARADEISALLDKFELVDEVERKSSQRFLEREGDRYLPSIDKLEGMMKWGSDFFASGNYKKAIEYFQQAADLKPNYDLAWMMIGNCHHALGDYERAVTFFKRALEQNPENEEGWYNLGNTLYHMGMHEDELACYDRAIALDKKYDKPWNNKGATLLELGKYDEAILCFEKGLAINPKNERVLNNRGVAQKRLGRLGDAVESFNRALVIDEKYDEARLNLGLALQEMGQPQQAVRAYDEVLSRVRSAELYAQKATALIEVERYTAAIDALDASLMMRPGWDVALELREKARALLKERGERAVAEVPKAPAPTAAPVEKMPPTSKEHEEAHPPEKEPAKQPDARAKIVPVAKRIIEPEPRPEPVPEISKVAPAPEAREPPALVRCPGCDSDVKGDANYCPYCGGSMKKEAFFCSECGIEVEEEYKHCPSCGASLDEEEEDAPEVAVEEFTEERAIERAEQVFAEEMFERTMDHLFAEAELRRRLGDTETALDLFQKASCESVIPVVMSDDPRVYVHIGICHLALGRHEDALASFEQAMNCEPENLHAIRGKVETLVAMERYAAAVDTIDALIDMEEGAGLWLLKAGVLEAWGKDAARIEALDRAAELSKESEDVWCAEGVALALTGKADDALLTFDRSVQLSPDYWEGWNNRGAVLLGKGEMALAAKYLDRAIDIEPKAFAPWLNRARLLSQQGRGEEAIECIDQALLLEQVAWAWAEKSLAFLKADLKEKALEAAESGLALDEDDPGCWNARGLALMRKGDLVEALDSFENAVARCPSFADARRNLELATDKVGGKGMQCPKCGAATPPGEKKCQKCGESLRRDDRERALTMEMENAIIQAEDEDAPSRKPKARKKEKARPSRDEFVARLMTVPGIGFAKANDLWEAGFKSGDDIARAEMADLTRIRGITPHLARKLKRSVGMED